MQLLKEFNDLDLVQAGLDLHSFATTLFPICRSITGNGLRQTLALIQDRIPLQITEVPTGTEVFDWTVPKEWNIQGAYLKEPRGERVVDFQKCNLHVLNYSVPIRETMPLSRLRLHLHTLPEHPDWIPYRTSYYKEDWGFCLSHKQMLALNEGNYEVCIESTLTDGKLTYGEYYLPGQSSDEVLISCHICHPSLANDNLSGLSVAVALAELLSGRDLRYSYRFIFIPGTIGAITWLARNENAAARIRHGLVLTGLGDKGCFHYKKSRGGDAAIDQAMVHVLRHCNEPYEILEFSPSGYDERQYCSPGFNLPVGCLMRSIWGSYAEYHTSADNLDFIQPLQLARSLRLCTAVLNVLESNYRFQNLNPFCEPQLGKRGLYRSEGGNAIETEIHARLWVLNFSDGKHSLLDIAERSGLPFSIVQDAAKLLLENRLLSVLSEHMPKVSGTDIVNSGTAKTRRARSGQASPALD